MRLATLVNWLLPAGMMSGIWILLLLPVTRGRMLGQLYENRAVELATFCVFLIAGIYALLLVARRRDAGSSQWMVRFHYLAGGSLIVLAGEEVAWGQWFFNWHTPEVWEQYNKQGETTFHNVGALQGRTEWLRLAFGVVGLAGLGLRAKGWLREIMPTPRLLPWLLAIVVFTLPDLYNDYFPFDGWIQEATNRTSEAVELLIALTALLYLREHAPSNARSALPGQ